MPELPEVETVKLVLEPQLTDRTIINMTLTRPEIIAGPAAELFARLIIGARIKKMGRRGKFLLMYLDTGDLLVIHLRMTGRLLVTPPDFPQQTHTHAVFHLNNGTALRFIDPRRFGRLWLGAEDKVQSLCRIDKLGPEPFDPGFTAEYLHRTLGKRRKSIKECLLEQSVVAGIGNIYADETLFAAGLSPLRPASSLTEREWRTLAAAIPMILQKGINDNRTTPQEYLAGGGKEYRNTPFLQIYGHSGTPCPRCGTPLERIVLGGRSCCFCPQCQK